MATISKVMAGAFTNITDFKTNPNEVMKQSEGEAVAVLKSNEPFFYAVPPSLYETMFEAMEDLALLLESNARLSDGEQAIEVNLNEL